MRMILFVLEFIKFVLIKDLCWSNSLSRIQCFFLVIYCYQNFFKNFSTLLNSMSFLHWEASYFQFKIEIYFGFYFIMFYLRFVLLFKFFWTKPSFTFLGLYLSFFVLSLNSVFFELLNFWFFFPWNTLEFGFHVVGCGIIIINISCCLCCKFFF
jgi:hypothetical protein